MQLLCVLSFAGKPASFCNCAVLRKSCITHRAFLPGHLTVVMPAVVSSYQVTLTQRWQCGQSWAPPTASLPGMSFVPWPIHVFLGGTSRSLSRISSAVDWHPPPTEGLSDHSSFTSHARSIVSTQCVCVLGEGRKDRLTYGVGGSCPPCRLSPCLRPQFPLPPLSHVCSRNRRYPLSPLPG